MVHSEWQLFVLRITQSAQIQKVGENAEICNVKADGRERFEAQSE